MDKLSKDDAELLRKAFPAEMSSARYEAEQRRFCKDIEKAFAGHPEETQLRREKLKAQQREAFLESHPSKEVVLRFVVDDISADRGNPRRSKDEPEPAPGQYRLGLSVPSDGPGLSSSMIVKLTTEEADWVSKGDCLVVRGKAHFSFDRSSKDFCPWCVRGGCVYMTLEKQSFTIIREKTDATIADAIKAKVAGLARHRSQGGQGSQP